MSNAQDRFESAMHDLLVDEGEIEPGDMVTHYAVVYAVASAEGGTHDGVAMLTSGERGLPSWQSRGLLTEGLSLIDGYFSSEGESD
jgi:hypothetical protein